MKTIVVMIGTRPEVIKLAPVVLALRARPREFRTVVCATAQHREMLDQMCGLFGIRPDLDLDLMVPNQQLPALTAKVMLRVTETFATVRPDCVLVQGDTTTAMVAALAAFYQRIPVGHVEAGLRTGNRYSPFPEEINRRLIGTLATVHFAPTEWSERALLSEGVPRERVFRTGNPVVDAVLMIAKRPRPATLPICANGHRTILVTAHRRENFGAPLEQICRALRTLTERHSDIQIVYPVHLNPNVQKPVAQLLADRERILLVDPLDYVAFVHLLREAYVILTDSGGIQEEAPVFGRPVLVLRQETERPEAVTAGVAKVVGTDADTIVAETERLLGDPTAYRAMANCVSPFGDGKAAERIVEILPTMI